MIQVSQKTGNLNCPPESTLRQLGRSSIESELFTLIDTHVESCEKCKAFLEELVRQPDSSAFDDSCLPRSLLPIEVPGYQLIEKLGRGGIGEVYLATEQTTERKVALKCLPGGWAIGNKGRDRWISEARAVAQISHPNVVRLYRMEETPLFYILVFEYVSGGTLQQRLKGPLKPHDAVSVIIQLTNALAEIHEAGLLHLDLKPANVLIEGSPEKDWDEITLKLADFGIARKTVSLDSTGDENCKVRGTPGYMAPEQLATDEMKLDCSTDIYSLGVIFYQLLTGVLPVHESLAQDSDRHFLNTHLNHDSSFNSQDFDSLLKICMKCMKELKSERYLSASQLRNDLQNWTDQWYVRQQVAETRSRSLLRNLFIRRIATCAVILLLTLSSYWYQKQNPLTHPSTKQASNLTQSQWIEILTSTLDQFHEEDLEWLLIQSRHQAQQVIAHGEMPLNSLVTFGNLVKSFSNRLNATLNKVYIEKADDFLEIASRILQESLNRAPNDPFVIHEFVLTEMDFCYLHIGNLDNSGKAYENCLIAMFAHLENVLPQIEKINDPRIRTVQQSRLLDFCRYHAIILKLQGLNNLADHVSEFENKCIRSFELINDSQDIQSRIRLARNEFPFPNRNWQELNSNESDQLCIEWIAKQMLDRMHGESDDSLFLRQFQNDIMELGIDSNTIPKAVSSRLRNLVSSVSTYYRANGKIELAEHYQKQFMKICELLINQFPSDPNSYLALSEAYLQSWKNLLQRNQPDYAVQALKNSLLAARNASMLAPELLIARDLVEDRERRIARFRGNVTQYKPNQLYKTSLNK